MSKSFKSLRLIFFNYNLQVFITELQKSFEKNPLLLVQIGRCLILTFNFNIN